jgi:butyrate kinase
MKLHCHKDRIAECSALLQPAERRGQFDDDGEYWCLGVQAGSETRRQSPLILSGGFSCVTVLTLILFRPICSYNLNWPSGNDIRVCQQVCSLDDCSPAASEKHLNVVGAVALIVIFPPVHFHILWGVQFSLSAVQEVPVKGQLILVINTGSTTTKCSIFSSEDNGEIEAVSCKTIEHPDDMIHRFPKVSDQVDYREKLVRDFFEHNIPADTSPSAVGALGGMLPPVPSGLIGLNKNLADFSLNTPVYQHASNLGAPLAFRIASTLGIPAFAADPVGVDEISPIARISGAPELPRFSYVHALNIRATVRKLAKQLSIGFDEVRCVACHLGGGYSIAPVAGGKIIDSDNRMEGAPFTPERAGGVPPIPLLEACFSGRYTKEELFKKLYGAGGLYAYLGTKDVREVARRAENGDGFARFIYDAMIYQICKEIGSMASVLDFNMHGILLTGGVANAKHLANEITRKCKSLGQVYIFPGENENEAIASSVLRVLAGKEKPLIWPDCVLTGQAVDPLDIFRDSNGVFKPVPFGVRDRI